MKKLFTMLLTLTLGLGLLAGCGGDSAAPVEEAPTGSEAEASADDTTDDEQAAAEAGELNLFTWEGMFPPEVLEAFTAETGITVNYSSFDSNETMLSRLQAADGGDYDLIIADDYISETVIAEGLAMPLDKELIPNLANVNPVYQGQFFDPEDMYTVPHGAGVQTIVYDPARLDIEILGYADLWNEALADDLAVVGNYRVVNGMALKVLGESYNVEDIATIEAAAAKLNELAPNIRLIKDDNLQDDLLSGEVSAAVMYTSQVTMAMLANPELKVVYPSEGVGFGLIVQFIPVNAPNSAAAHAFIDFILRPEIGKQSFEWLGYYCTNQAADALIADEYKPFLTLPADFDNATEMIQNISLEADEAHVKAWTEFKSLSGQ